MKANSSKSCLQRTNLLLLDPRRHQRHPVQARGAHVHHAVPRHRGGRGVVDVLGLEDQLAVGHHGQPVAVGQGERLVVVEHGVEVLDPHGVDGAVEDEPDVVLLADLEGLAPERGEDAVRPVVGGHVEPAEHLARGDGLTKKRWEAMRSKCAMKLTSFLNSPH